MPKFLSRLAALLFISLLLNPSFVFASFQRSIQTQAIVPSLVESQYSNELHPEVRSSQIRETPAIHNGNGRAENPFFEISLLKPADYWSLIKTLRHLSEEAMGMTELTAYMDDGGPASQTLVILERMAGHLEIIPSHILSVFIAKDVSTKEMIGARVLLKPGEIPDGDFAKGVTGEDVIRLGNQRQGVGTQLRLAAFRWMMDHGYHRYVAQIDDDNAPSRQNLLKVAEQLGANVTTVPNPENYQTWYMLNFETTSVPAFLKTTQLDSIRRAA